MADRPYQFVGPILQAMHAIADQVGTDVMWSGRDLYNAVVELICLHAMTLKIIQDLHPTLVTDQVLQQRLNEAIDTGPNGDRSGWPGWVLMQIAPEDLARYGATTADTLATLQTKIAIWNQSNGGV